MLIAGRTEAAQAPGDQEIRRAVDAVYERPEFQARSGSNLIQELTRKLRELFDWLGTLQDTKPALFWILLVGLSVLLAVLITHLAWTVRRALSTGERHRVESGAAQRRFRSRKCFEEAQQLAARRDFTEAIRFLFLSLVYYFDESGRLAFQDSCTNREYLALFADRPNVHAELAYFVDALDDYWYAQRPADQGHYDDCLFRYRRLT